MLVLKITLMAVGFGMMAAAVSILGHDLRRACHHCGLHAVGAAAIPAKPPHWSTSMALGFLAWGPILLSMSILLIASGR